MVQQSILAWLLSLLLAFVSVSESAAEETRFDFRFADAQEGAALLLANTAYTESLSQNDLNFRMQRTAATRAEWEAHAAAQTRDFTEAEMTAVEASFGELSAFCTQRGLHLPPSGEIVLIKTTMHEECDAGAYTHGTEIYLGETILSYIASEEPAYHAYGLETLAHELFHCLTRNNPQFRAEMYAVLGFTVQDEDFAFAEPVRERIIQNPDVEHHNAWATFRIRGEDVPCAVVFTTTRPFEQPGDSFFDLRMTGLVPLDGLSEIIPAEEAENFWEVFGRNTNYVIDPEETMADNFGFALVYGEDRPDGKDYQSPAIIEAVLSLLRAG